MPVKVHLDHVGMAFTTPGGTFRAVAPMNLSIESGRFVSLVGPSGCGKSTLFNVIAGLLQPTEGRVLIDGEDATGTIGRVGYMLQKDLLLPWRTVLDNVILGMEVHFYEQLPKLFPHTDAKAWFKDLPDNVLEYVALRNGSLQGAYFLLAARALGRSGHEPRRDAKLGLHDFHGRVRRGEFHRGHVAALDGLGQVEPHLRALGRQPAGRQQTADEDRGSQPAGCFDPARD